MIPFIRNFFNNLNRIKKCRTKLTAMSGISYSVMAVVTLTVTVAVMTVVSVTVAIVVMAMAIVTVVIIVMTAYHIGVIGELALSKSLSCCICAA